jgi:hypothetical protein
VAHLLFKILIGAMDIEYFNDFKNVESLAVLANNSFGMNIKMTRILIVAFNLNGVKNV